MNVLLIAPQCCRDIFMNKKVNKLCNDHTETINMEFASLKLEKGDYRQIID